MTCTFQMNFLLGVERALLADLVKGYNEQKAIDDKTMTGDKHLKDQSIRTDSRTEIFFLGLAYFYGYDNLHHALELLKQTKRLDLYRTLGPPSRRLYQFHANKNQVSVYTLSTSNFCTCTFYKKHILIAQDYFVCPHNLAVKLYEALLTSNADVEIESFDLSEEYFIEKLSKVVEQSSEFFSQ